MVAEKKDAGESQRPHHLTMIALYEREEYAEELLARLSALKVDTSEATIVRVDMTGPPPRSGSSLFSGQSALHPTTRGAVTGAIIGGAIALLIGLWLYEAGVLKLPFLTGLFSHIFISVIAGAIIGTIIGLWAVLLAELLAPAEPPPPVVPPARQSDGFLTVVKIPPHLAEQAETIARRSGAKEIIL
jgi:hypothetical protein